MDFFSFQEQIKKPQGRAVAKKAAREILTVSQLTGQIDRSIKKTFPSIVEGKPLISHPEEKLEFRFILNQRVFETTFIVNPTNLFNGTETVMRTPSRVDVPTPAALP